MRQMLVEDHGAPALEPQAAPRAASLLLHFLAVALLVCIAAGATLYLYWAFSNVVSNYRRHMNAAAYEAQHFFDQRESLLRAISASAVRNTNQDPISKTPRISARRARWKSCRSRKARTLTTGRWC
ncbi:hypothetical protein [Achromobacter piechaudii]|uniref:hypothetical protein n=1 Tax=Achromobacter piechaudii TaxID=72556 RepID=UPI003DA7F151